MPRSVSDQDLSHSNNIGRQGATQGTPLPPSVERAYYRKCLELKRRINEVEETNDVLRVRRARINRGILKLRLERAFLLEQLQKRMAFNVDDSDQSTSPPPTPQDKPLRSKRLPRKASPEPAHVPADSPPVASTQGRANDAFSSPRSASDARLPATRAFDNTPNPSNMNGNLAADSQSQRSLHSPHHIPAYDSPGERPHLHLAGRDNGVELSHEYSSVYDGSAYGEHDGAAQRERRETTNGGRRASPDSDVNLTDSRSVELSGFTAVNR